MRRNSSSGRSGGVNKFSVLIPFTPSDTEIKLFTMGKDRKLRNFLKLLLSLLSRFVCLSQGLSGARDGEVVVVRFVIKKPSSAHTMAI